MELTHMLYNLNSVQTDLSCSLTLSQSQIRLDHNVEVVVTTRYERAREGGLRLKERNKERVRVTHPSRLGEG